MSAHILVSRNKREGGYAGWRVTGGRNCLNWHCRQINHERVGAESRWSRKLTMSLRDWSRA